MHLEDKLVYSCPHLNMWNVLKYLLGSVSTAVDGCFLNYISATKAFYTFCNIRIVSPALRCSFYYTPSLWLPFTPQRSKRNYRLLDFKNLIEFWCPRKAKAFLDFKVYCKLSQYCLLKHYIRSGIAWLSQKWSQRCCLLSCKGQEFLSRFEKVALPMKTEGFLT